MNVASPAAVRGLVRYEPSLDAEILRFNREGYPTRREDWVEPRWRWMFLDSATRLGVEPMVWMYRAKTGIVAHQGAIAVKLRAGNREFVTGWFVETMVLEAYRGRAVGPMVVKKALEDLPLNLSLGQTPEMRALQFALGWVEVSPLSSFAYALNPAAVVEGKVAPLLKPLAATALWGRQRWRTVRATSDLEVGEVDRFGVEHDRLWARVAPRFACAVVRDASYLNWKYVAQPGQTFRRLEIRRGEDIVAVVVVTTRDQEPGYAYRRGFIVDVVVDPGDRPAVHGALRAACDSLQRAGADLAWCDVINPALESELEACGFLRREATRWLLVSTAGADAAAAAVLRDPGAWLVTAGDSDIDRPW